MGMNGLQNLVQVLDSGANQIEIDPAIREQAVIPIQRMLDFAAQQGIGMRDKGNA
jgi:quinolinate synthase